MVDTYLMLLIPYMVDILIVESCHIRTVNVQVDTQHAATDGSSTSYCCSHVGHTQLQ